VQIRVDDPPYFLDDEWLTREELDSNRRQLDRKEIQQESARGVKVERQDHVPPPARNTTSERTSSISVPIEEEEMNHQMERQHHREHPLHHKVHRHHQVTDWVDPPDQL
jgi:hypothetical protein